ncbi:MAG: DNA polymerase III subunit gamma/tau [Bacilli bacterium]|nr:DNA polymerase III subunit gamma/tau [Bacilli bacterium]
MEYLALYRKYRPSNLYEMVGQNEIRKIIASSIKNGTISHAYLFSGPRGTGKTTTAKIMAKMVNCENLHDDMPCNECPSCLSASSGSDIIEIDAASNNGVDEIRDLREKANLVPSVCKYKVYIIDEVHMLTNQAFNALLKTLEEPPKHVIFILATTEYYKIPLTITSRCQKFQFNKIDVVDIVKKLREIADIEKIEISDEALYEIAKISDGGMRDSINFLDQLRSFSQGNITLSDVYEVCGNVSLNEICNLLCNLKNNNLEKITEFLENLNNNGKNYGKFLEDVMMFLKDLILYKKEVTSKLIKTDSEYLSKVSEMYCLKDIFYVIDIINQLVDKIKNVTRQSVVVISNFLLVANKFNSLDVEEDTLVLKKIKKEENNQEYGLAFNFTYNDKKEYTDLTVNKEDVSSKVINENNNIVIKNKDVIINNALALADKKLKISLQEKWNNVCDYLTDSHYSSVVGKWTDVTLEVVGDNYIIFTVLYESLINGVYLNEKLSNDFVNMILDGKYNYVVITNEEWNKHKEEYINNIKNGIKYEVKKLVLEENKDNNQQKEATIVDRLFDIVGEENLEFK